MNVVVVLFFVLLASVSGGILAKSLKIPVIVGYIIGGILFGAILPESVRSLSWLAELGTILLLFSVGVELSFERLSKFLKVAVFGSLIQIVLVTAISFLFLRLFHLDTLTSFILSMGFALSSTAVVVKLLSDRGELNTIHGGIMLGWLLIQDLAVIPMMVILPVLASAGNSWELPLVLALGKAALVVAITVVLGKLLIPYLIHRVVETNSRELLLLASTALALGTAAATSFFGISPALGAFLAGVVISESYEHHAVFAETRPLRDLFVAVFFVSLGFMVAPQVLLSNLVTIIVMAVSILVLKSLVVFAVSEGFGYRGKVAVANSLGLAQVGEFAFVIFSFALGMGLLTSEATSIGIAVTLLTLLVTPLVYGAVVPFWRKMRDFTRGAPFFSKLFSTGESSATESLAFDGHIIICGYGRVGKWVGRALGEFDIPFVVVEYDQSIVGELRKSGTPVLYGDPTEPEVMESADIRKAKAVVIAIPDRIAQETLIGYVQTVAPDVKIISRAHLDEDWEKLKSLRVDKVIQPEFEAAVAIIRSVLVARGKDRNEVARAIRGLRVAHAK